MHEVNVSVSMKKIPALARPGASPIGDDLDYTPALAAAHSDTSRTVTRQLLRRLYKNSGHAKHRAMYTGRCFQARVLRYLEYGVLAARPLEPLIGTGHVFMLAASTRCRKGATCYDQLVAVFQPERRRHSRCNRPHAHRHRATCDGGGHRRSHRR